MYRKDIFKDSKFFIRYISGRLNKKTNEDSSLLPMVKEAAAVLFLLSHDSKNKNFEPYLILNKRSQKVAQPGDLCCPGGGIKYGIDSFFSRSMLLLKHRSFFSQKDTYNYLKNLYLTFAAGLREGFEEMRLNPFGVKIIGSLPVQELYLSARKIFPIAAWVSRQKYFFPNWEVEEIVYIPVKELLNKKHYACYNLNIQTEQKNAVLELPCFKYNNELLWGVTFRITMSFLNIVFDFKTPSIQGLPVIKGSLNKKRG